MRTRQPAPVNADGEIVTQTPAHFTISPGAVAVFAPGSSRAEAVCSRLPAPRPGRWVPLTPRSARTTSAIAIRPSSGVTVHPDR